MQSGARTDSGSAAGSGSDQQFFLDRTQYLFDRIGNPERSMRIVHLAGTSGKGSSAMMVYEAARRSHARVGLYLSPYLSTPIENIQFNGLFIDPADFVRLTYHILDVARAIEEENPQMMPSYAELFFAIAMLYFAEQDTELLVLETGAGGRYDKTNIIPAPEVALLTPIGIDHTRLLGKTIEEIAGHKAGIIKPGSTVVSTEQNPAVQEVFKAEAQKQDVDITFVQPERFYRTQLPGRHQQMNAAGASAACEALGIPSKAIIEGIAAARMPARIERMQSNPTVIIDGAHSAPKMNALRDTIDEFRPWQKLHLLFAMKEGKDPRALLEPLASLADTATFTSYDLPAFSSVAPEAVADVWREFGSDAPIPTIEHDADAAFKHCMSQAGPDDLVLITGSLYIAGKPREYWYPLEDILRERTWWPSANTSTDPS